MSDKDFYVFDFVISPNDYDTIYSDMDNTLILWTYGACNTSLIKFLDRSKNRGKKICVLTRAINPEEVLSYFKIIDLFDDIIIADKGRPKSSYIKGDAIFVDDKEDERTDVLKRARIPVFDPASNIFRTVNSFSFAKLKGLFEREIQRAKDEFELQKPFLKKKNWEEPISVESLDKSLFL